MGAIAAPPIKRPFLALPDGWDATWKAAKAAAGSTPARVTAFGDSITAGSSSSNFLTKPWAALVRDALTTRHGYSADFWHAGMNPDFSGFAGATAPWATNNTAGRVWNSGVGFLQEPLWAGGAPSPALTFTTPYACTDLDIWYSDNINQANGFSYAVDGGAAVQVTTGGTAYQKKIALTGLANTTHTIVFAGVSANAAMRIAGVTTYKSKTSGVQFARIGANSFQCGQLTVENFDAWAGKSDASTWAANGFPAQPHLAFVEFGVNDCQNSTYGPDIYADQLRKIVSYLRRAQANCSVIFLVPSFPNGVSSDGTAYFTNPESWPQYVARIYDIARFLNCAVYNIHAQQGETTLTDGYRTSGDAHPTDTSHALIASTLAGVL